MRTAKPGLCRAEGCLRPPGDRGRPVAHRWRKGGRGAGLQIDALAISNSTDVIIRIYLYLRELCRVEPEKPVPPVEFIDWLFTRNRLHQVRNEQTLELFRQTVERWARRASPA